MNLKFLQQKLSWKGMKTCSSYSHRFSLFHLIFRKVCSREKIRELSLERKRQVRDTRYEIRDTRRMRKIFIKDIFNILLLSLIQTTWNQLSPIRRADGPPFSPERSCVLQFPLVVFCILNFYKKIFRFTPAICKDCTVPRIRQNSCWARTKSCPCWLLVYWIEIRMDFL